MRSTQDISKLTNAQKNLLIWEHAESPDYQVGIAVSLRSSRHGFCAEMRQQRPLMHAAAPRPVCYVACQFISYRLVETGALLSPFL